MCYPTSSASNLQPRVPRSVVVAYPTGDGAVDSLGLLPTQVLLDQGREVRGDLLVDPGRGSKGPVHVPSYPRGVPEDARCVVLGPLEGHISSL